MFDRRIKGSAAVLLAGAFLLAAPIAAQADDFNTIEKGIFIDCVDVSGMTGLEAEAAVNDYVAKLSDATVTLNALNDNRVSVKAGELGLKWSNHQVVTEAGELGKSGNIVQRYKALKDLEHENRVFDM